MKFNELVFSRNRHLTVYEKNKLNKLFDDKPKRMPEDISEKLSEIDVIEVEESTGLTIVVLDCGKTAEELEKDRHELRRNVKDALNKIALASAMMMSSFPFCDELYKWRF